MNKREYLNQQLNEVREKLSYRIPENGDMLWKVIIWKLFTEKFISSFESKSYQIEGIVVILPDFIERTLREMIMGGIEAFKDLYKRIKGIKMSINIMSQSSAFSMFITKSYMNFYGKQLDKRHNYMYCLMEMGMYQTEWSVVLISGNNK